MNKTEEIFKGKPKNFISLLLLAITAFFCTLPLFIHQGLPLAHDLVFHIFQADQFSNAINDGVFYPRWVLDSNNGYGSPSFIFYAPLSYYFVSAVNFIVGSIHASMIIAAWFSFFISGISMFVLIKKMFKDVKAALASSIIYQLLPFHFMDLYIRGTFAELFAFIWFPLIILFMYKMFYSRNNKKAFAGLSISYAGLILTHLVSGFIFSFVIGAYLIYNYFILKDKKSFLTALSSLLFGFGLSSFYLMPVIYERQFVQIEYIMNCPVGDYRKNFLFTWDKVQSLLSGFYITLHISVILQLALFAVIVLILKATKRRLFDKSIDGFFIIIFLVAFFLTIPLSRPIWDLTPGFAYLQFPWRWAPMMELSLCILIGSIFSGVDKWGLIHRDQKKRMVLYIITALFLLSFVMALKSRSLPEEFIKKAQEPEYVKSIMDPTVEYTPVWVTDINKIMLEDSVKKVSVISGLAEYSVTEWKSEKRLITIKAHTPSLLRVSTFYYPGWEAELNGKKTQIRIEKDSGAMLVDVPKGDYMLELRFKDTPIRYYSKIISMISLIVLLLIIAVKNKISENEK